MAALNFPNSPVYGDIYDKYKWDGEKWCLTIGGRPLADTESDPYWANTKLLMGFEGANASTGAPGMTDESVAARGTASVFGTAQIDTSKSVFGLSSLNTGTSVIKFPDSVDFHFTNQPFTVECRIFNTGSGGTRFILGQWGASTLSWILYLGSNALTLNTSTDGSNNAGFAATGTVPSGVWSAICVDFDGSKYRLYVNGVMTGSSTTLRNIYGSSGRELSIGGNESGGFNFGDNVEEIRITKGVGRYILDAGYTIRTRAFPRFGPTAGTEAAAFLARTSGLNAMHTAAYIGLINGLVADGIWSKLDVLHVYATDTSANALLNLVSTTPVATRFGATFTADRGFTGVDGSATDYIDTGFSAVGGTPKFTDNSGHISAWSVTSIAAATRPIIGVVGSSTDSSIFPYVGGNAAYFRVNGAGATSLTGVTNSIGHYLANRTSSGGGVDGYKNAVSVGNTSGGSVSVENYTFYTLRWNIRNLASGIGSGAQVAMASIGSGLTAGEITNFYNRLRTYMSAVGVL